MVVSPAPTESSQPVVDPIPGSTQIDGQTVTVPLDTASTSLLSDTPVVTASPEPQPLQPISDSSQPNDPSPVVVPAPSTETIVDPQITEQPLPAPADTTVSTTLDTPIQIQTAVEQTPLAMSSPAPVVVETVTPGGDDSSYRIPITVPVLFNGVEYTNIYATTNSVIAFGREDGTYWDYPNTPSISIESKDWWVLPQQMPDTHFIIRTSDGGFQVDGVYRPFGSMTGATTQIVITAQILTDGNVSYTYSVDGPLQGNERTGARLQNGTVVTLEQAGVTQVEAPVVLAPESISQEELAAQQAAAEAARLAAEQAAAAEAARIEAERLAAIESARIAAEAEAARLAAIEAARIAAEAEAARVEAERVAAEAAAAEAARIEAERLEAERIAREAAEAAARIPQVPAGASTVSEGGSIDFVAPEGKRIATINAWYGDPADGSRGMDVSAQLTQEFAGKTSATIQSSNQYGDPAGGTVKILIVLVTYEDVPVTPPVEPAPSTPEVSPVTPPQSGSQDGQTPGQTPDPNLPAPGSSGSTDPQTPPPSTTPPSDVPAPTPDPTPSENPSLPDPITPPNPVEPLPPSPEVEPEPLPEPEQPPVEPEEPAPIPEDPSTVDPDTEEPLPPIEEPLPPVEPETPPVEPEVPTEPEAPVEPEQEPELPQPEQENPLEESSPEPSTPEEAVDTAVEDAKADGKVTEAEKEIIAEALVASLAPGESLTKEQIQDAGIEYKDLPPTTPVEVRQDENGNEVIITADVAAALVLLENPAELIGELFNDPGQALQALGSIGADMSPQEREEAEKMVVAAVIAGGAALNAVGAAAAGGTTSGGSTGGGSGGGGGGGASGESGYRRRKP